MQCYSLQLTSGWVERAQVATVGCLGVRTPLDLTVLLKIRTELFSDSDLFCTTPSYLLQPCSLSHFCKLYLLFTLCHFPYWGGMRRLDNSH